MNTGELKAMRQKQIIYSNVLFLLTVLLYIIMMNLLEFSFSTFFMIMGGALFLQALYILLKYDSTRSVIPVFEEVYTYEKQKMGQEWSKQRKVGGIVNLFLGVLMFWQAYVSFDSIPFNLR